MRPVPLLLAAAWLAAAGLSASAQTPKGGLDFVPSTAGGFVTVKLSDLMAMESMKAVREAVARIEKLEGGRLTDAFGVSLDEIERVTVFWPAPPADGPLDPYVVVRSKAPFNEARVLKALRAVPAGDGHRRGKEAWPTPAAKAEDRPAPRPPVKDPLPPKFEQPGSDGAQEGRGRGQPAREAPAEPVGSGDGPDLFYLEHSPFAAVYLIDDRTLFFLPEGNRGGHGLVALVGQLLRRKADG